MCSHDFHNDAYMYSVATHKSYMYNAYKSETVTS